MMELWKLIENKAIPVRLISFNLLLMCWEEDTETINFKTEKEVAAGAYRKCFKAYISCSKFGAKTFAIKNMMLQGQILNCTKMHQDLPRCTKSKLKKLFKCTHWQKILLIILVKKYILRHMGNILCRAPCILKS